MNFEAALTLIAELYATAQDKERTIQNLERQLKELQDYADSIDNKSDR